ncbi:MAG: ABC transporter permease [Spirochaetales bacterium]|nr:ABC transporter permease [Spirochaetales bacterium]
MGKIRSLVKKEFRQIRRTKAYFALIFVAPFMQLLIMGSAITNEVKNIPLVIVDQDKTPSSREIIDKFKAVSIFDYLGEAHTAEEATLGLDDGLVKAAIIIPRGFERDMERGLSPAVQVLVDGVDGNSAGISLGYITSMAAGIQKGWMMARKLPVSGGVQVIPRYFYNPELDSKLNFVPGLIGLLLLMITTMLTAINIVREKELGTLEQLMVTPLGGTQLIIGKIIPFTILGLLQFSMGILAARLVFGIPVQGSIPLLYGMVLLFIMTTLGMGIFFSTVANTQQQAMFVAWFSMIFTLLLSGFFVPINNMPRIVQYLTYLNPLRYFITVLREIYLKGTPFRNLWKEAVILGGMGVFLILASSMRFHKRLK